MSAIKTTDAIGSSLLPSQKISDNKPNIAEGVSKKRAEAEKVAQDFETMFVELMVKSMRQTAQREDLSNAEDIYQGMLDSEYSKGMAKSSTFGIKEQVLNWLEQTDPQLQSDNSQQSGFNANNADSAETQKLRNEALALKAATQAYQLSSGSR